MISVITVVVYVVVAAYFFIGFIQEEAKWQFSWPFPD